MKKAYTSMVFGMVELKGLTMVEMSVFWMVGKKVVLKEEKSAALRVALMDV